MRLKRWTLPRDYMGAHWDGYYIGPVGRHRDSDHVTESNWAEMLREMSELPPYDGDGDGERGSRIVVCESHWAVGWVEWYAIHETDAAALALGNEMAERLEGYPLLNEDEFCEREWSAAREHWERASVRERVELCQEYGISVFAARRDCLPQDDSGALFDYLRGD